MTNDSLHQLVVHRFRAPRRYRGVVRPPSLRWSLDGGSKDFHPWTRWLRSWGPSGDRGGIQPGWMALRLVWLLPGLRGRRQSVEQRQRIAQRLDVTLSGHFGLFHRLLWRLPDAARRNRTLSSEKVTTIVALPQWQVSGQTHRSRMGR